ncbi:NAD(P)H-quinone oxidoreductase subunit L [Macleaya cordata]|uniref:NAD(P)H-quinone oxidoreductase subunit L n=1 Tax=Macleaya cordata TaxID=56857 RepID=A0A200PU17_MACCD|nr:NAD(P)H-quinone oxidoreductase subunit L [Macleaya cordata]
MNCSLSLSTTTFPAAYKSRLPSLNITSKITQQPHHKPKKLLSRIASKPTINYLWPKNSSLSIQIGALLTLVEQPALAVTGVNNEEELSWKLIQLGIIAFWYFLIMPPIILNWLRTRWYRRKFVEMYLQFMFMFMFFPGILLWAPFVNFRQLPQDPTMKYPWSTPKDPSLTDSK